MKTYKDDFADVVIYDNNGRTFDRYTVIIGEAIFCMSDNAESPSGINMFARMLDEDEDKRLQPHLGKKVTVMQIPLEVRRAIMHRMKSNGNNHDNNQKASQT